MDKRQSMLPEFERGAIEGFTEGAVIICGMLSEIAGKLKTSHPAKSAFLSGISDSMRKNIPDLILIYCESKDLTVSITGARLIWSDDAAKWCDNDLY